MKNQYRDINLKSSSWITDASGSVNQYLAYMPFGEQFIDQRQTGHDIRFKFTGKERDAETGFDYFGARYYDSGLSVWLSARLPKLHSLHKKVYAAVKRKWMDPLADMYSGISPYAYVFNNPVMFVDKWGLEGEPVKMRVRKVHSDRDGQEKFRFKNKTTGAKGYIYTPKGKKAKDVKNDFTNGTMNNYDVYTYNNGDLTNEQHYDNNGDLMGDVQFGGNLSGVDIITKGYPKAYYEHKKAGDTYYSHNQIKVLNDYLRNNTDYTGAAITIGGLIVSGVEKGGAVGLAFSFAGVAKFEMDYMEVQSMLKSFNNYLNCGETGGLFLVYRPVSMAIPAELSGGNYGASYINIKIYYSATVKDKKY